MNRINKNKFTILICTLASLSLIALIAFFNSNLLWHSNVDNYLEKTYGQHFEIRDNREFSYKGKNYKVVLSTPKDSKDQLYLQCFEERMNGLFYKPTYGAMQGESSSLYGMTYHFINDGTNDGFIVVYGLNRDHAADSYSVRDVDSGNWLNQDISKEEYFLQIHTDIAYPEIVFNDAQGNDISSIFRGQ